MVFHGSDAQGVVLRGQYARTDSIPLESLLSGIAPHPGIQRRPVQNRQYSLYGPLPGLEIDAQTLLPGANSEGWPQRAFRDGGELAGRREVFGVQAEPRAL